MNRPTRYHAILATLWLLATTAAATEGEPRTVNVIAGERYAKPPGGQTWVFGENYRKLWTTPIEVEVLDLGRFASGLTPLMRVGGEQTKGLALKGGNGLSYTFRAVDKDLTHVLPEFLRIETLEDVAQDQLSANVPGVEVVAYPFTKALGVLEPEARLVVMPDDPALGEYREDFAGVLGTFLEYPQPGFEGASEIQGHDEFWERRQEDPWNRADTAAFLRARLLDLFFGDWDRHRGQWRWARIPGKRFLQPLPEDRDQVFCDFEGLAMTAARASGAQLVTFEPEYPPLDDGTQNGWDLDRFLLTDLSRAEWMEVAREVVDRLTDGVIEQGLTRLPPEYYARVGDELAKVLRTRRDTLVEHAERYYTYLAKKVDVHGSNQSDLARIRYLDDRSIEVQISLLSEKEPYYVRRFSEDETQEVRIYLHGGDNRLVVEGEDRVGIKIHVVGGDGSDVVEAPERTDVEFWDHEGEKRVVGDVRVHSGPYRDPGLRKPNEDVPWVPSRDFGRATRPLALFGYHADAGLVVGSGFDSTSYGFRKYPWSSRNILRGAFAIGVNRPFVDYQGDFRRRAAKWHINSDNRQNSCRSPAIHGRDIKV
jgi:hypothetical protein